MLINISRTRSHHKATSVFFFFYNYVYLNMLVCTFYRSKNRNSFASFNFAIISHLLCLVLFHLCLFSFFSSSFLFFFFLFGFLFKNANICLTFHWLKNLKRFFYFKVMYDNFLILSIYICNIITITRIHIVIISLCIIYNAYFLLIK